MSRALPLVALVGRPNVGKSTLFNRLVGARTALVDDQPGVTRDRLYGHVEVDGKTFGLIDTGGLDPGSSEEMQRRVHEQATVAIEEADFICMVTDGRAGCLPADEELGALLRRADKPTAVVVTKLDTPDLDDNCHEFHKLGLQPVLAFSGEHNRGLGELCELLVSGTRAPDIEAADDAQAPIPVQEAEDELPQPTRIEWDGGPIHVAVVGRPNVGKSSLVNRLLGEDRVLASDVPGTTRDAIDVELDAAGQKFVLIDTAGMRRKRTILERVERYAVFAAIRGVERADIALLVLDASRPVGEQDARISGMADDRGKGLIILVNKWDTIESAEAGDAYIEEIQRRLPMVKYAPILRISAKTGRSVAKLPEAIIAVQRERHRRVSTGELNRFFKQTVDAHPPPFRGTRRPRMYFATQPLVRPPTFVIAASKPDAIANSYRRYLENALRRRFGYEGSPLWLKFRQRGKQKDSK